jgi:transposase
VAEIRPRKGSQGICSGCCQPGPTYDHLPARQWRFVLLWALPVFFLYALRRINCFTCGVKAERVPWATGKLRLTNAFRFFLAQWARKLSWREVADCFLVSWADVYESVKWVVDYGLKNRDLSGISAIGVDEILVSKGRHFWTLAYQIDAGCRRLLWIGKDRTERTFHGFFDSMGTAMESVRHVCSDMWKPYLKVIRQRLPEALHILDRFHIRMNERCLQ